MRLSMKSPLWRATAADIRRMASRVAQELRRTLILLEINPHWSKKSLKVLSILNSVSEINSARIWIMKDLIDKEYWSVDLLYGVTCTDVLSHCALAVGINCTRSLEHKEAALS
jgi:hypothetical protein